MASAMRAADFVGTIGVNVHLSGLPASRAADIVGALEYLGVDLIRTGANAAMLEAGGLLSRLALAEVEFDILLPGRISPGVTIDALEQFAIAHPGSVQAIEGPNEVNNFPFTYEGLTGAAAGLAFFDDALAEIEGSSALSSVAKYDLTGVPQSDRLSTLATDYVNLHPYPKLGKQPYNVLAKALSLRPAEEKGVVITETGYHTGATGAAWEAVDEITQAKLTLNLLADAVRLGVAATYLYDLADKPDPTGISVDANLGLFDQTLQPKPVATALHNLTSILKDDSVEAATFATDTFDYTLTGMPASGSSLLLEKASGVHALLVWAEPDIWNETTNASIQAPLSRVKVHFAALFDVSVFDPLISDQPIATYQSVSDFILPVRDHTLVVEIAAVGTLEAGGGQSGAAPLNLVGTGGTNTLLGASGDDFLTGLAGNDILRGGAGNDVLIGGLGADQLLGGSGADTFVFKAAAESKAVRLDLILDFSAAEGDRLDLSGIDASTANFGNQKFHLGGSYFAGDSGELIQVLGEGGVRLLADVNGDGLAEFELMLVGQHSLLSPSDILL